MMYNTCGKLDFRERHGKYMETISRKFLQTAHFPEDVAVGPLEEMPVKVMQFGEGNFLRAFVDWLINEINRKDLFCGSVVVVQPLEKGMVDMLNAQDDIYTLYLRGVENGKVTVSKNIVTAIKDAINPYTQWDRYLEYAKGEQLRFIISNTTEAGIEFKEEPYTKGVCQNTYPAKLTALLYERYQAFHGDKDKGLVIIPCELIDRNGDHLKDAVMKYAQLWNLGEEFVEWIQTACAFMNTLVDRIVPGFPRDEFDALTKEQGYLDNLIVTAEIFHFWVIEGDKKYAEEIPFHKAGLNVLWTDNMEPYRTRKVRILNGAHTMTVLAAYLCGLDTVGECMKDADIRPFMEKGIFEQIIPTFKLAEEEKQMFAKAVLERFENPFIKHMLLSISLNSVSKYKVRVLPSVEGYIQRFGTIPSNTVFALAALIAFYRGTKTEDGKYMGAREGNTYEICDMPEVLTFFENAWKKYDQDHNVQELVEAVLKNQDFWEQDLTKIPGLSAKVCEYLENILTKGMREAVKQLF